MATPTTHRETQPANLPADKSVSPRLAVLLSGGGSTMQNLADRIADGRLNASIALVIASNSKAGGIEKANRLGLPVRVLPRKDFADAATFSAAVFDVIDEHDCDLVCLAGFLSLLVIPEEYEGRVLNIHPSLLPKFGGKGMHGQLVHQAVLDAGETESGCTVHLADNTYDTGPVLLQRRCPVEPGDNAASLAARIFELECEAYPQAITDYWRALRSV